jgi:hypothetical protein
VFIITWAIKTIEGLLSEPMPCSRCQSDCRDVLVRYNCVGIFWVFNFSNQRQCEIVCRQCGRKDPLSKPLAQTVMSSLIPLKDRYGFFVLFAIVSAFVIPRLF